MPSIRTLANVSDQPLIDKELDAVRRAVSEVERKLADHNGIDANHIYQLAGSVLNTQEQDFQVQLPTLRQSSGLILLHRCAIYVYVKGKTHAEELKMELKRNGTQSSIKGPEDNFTGNVRIDPLFEAPDPARARCASVTFEPGAHSAWHRHPLGQILIVTSGCGWVQSEGQAKVEIRPGDVVWCPANERHWHGATPTTAMTHIAIQEALDGKVIEWMEKVSDEQYNS